MGATHRLSVVVLVSVASAFPTPLWGGASTQPEILDNDMHKLNEYLQAEKAASTNMESLYVDLQHKFNFLKNEWSKDEAERLQMRKSLRTAQAQVEQLSKQNERLTMLLNDVNSDQQRMLAAKDTIMQTLAMREKVNITAALLR